ncbi:hypothetical protein [Methanohalobium sp.]|uniref:hypothetical protein n=1 Tax=Methanohalobium sp. TaxID=2837493 RepID=UPI0026013B60|nr:hypothetical protein [Methanohalobium sp.]
MKLFRKICILTFVLLLTVSFATATTNGDNESIITKEDGYIVTPAEDTETNVGIMTISDSISQGETNWNYKYVEDGSTALNVDLNWGDVDDSLKLTIHTADGHKLGPYYDSDDGTVDGRINLKIDNSNGLASGCWEYEVYGQQVDGTEDYTI